jgi:hypothetical protein
MRRDKGGTRKGRGRDEDRARDAGWRFFCSAHSETGFPVKKTRTEIVEPIDSAIDLVKTRIDAIKKELGLIPPNTKTLQIVLQGSIMLRTFFFFSHVFFLNSRANFLQGFICCEEVFLVSSSSRLLFRLQSHGL